MMFFLLHPSEFSEQKESHKNPSIALMTPEERRQRKTQFLSQIYKSMMMVVIVWRKQVFV